MAPRIPSWSETLIRARLKTDETVTRFEMLEDSRLNKIGVAYTDSRALLARKPLIGSASIREIKSPEARALETAEGREVACGSCGRNFHVLTENQGLDHCIFCGSATGETPETEAAPTETAEVTPFTLDGYTLHGRDVELRGGRTQTIYFFAKRKPKSGHPVPMPAGYEVGGKHPTTGLPYLHKAEVTPEPAPDPETTTPEAPVSPQATRSFGEVPVERVHGVGEAYGKDLRAAGITSVEAFRKADAAKVAELTGASEDRVASWKRLGNLLDVKGIGDVYVAKLLAANITNVEHLLKTDTEAITEKTGIATGFVQRFQRVGGLLEVKGVGPKLVQGLLGIGITDLEDLATAKPSRVAEVQGVGMNQARSFIQSARNMTQGHR